MASLPPASQMRRRGPAVLRGGPAHGGQWTQALDSLIPDSPLPEVLHSGAPCGTHPLALPPLPGGLELGSGSLVTTPTFLSEELSGLLQDRTHAGASCLGCARWIPAALDPGSHRGEGGWRAFGSETFLLPETTSLMLSHRWTPRKQDGLSWLLPGPVMAALLRGPQAERGLWAPSGQSVVSAPEAPSLPPSAEHAQLSAVGIRWEGKAVTDGPAKAVVFFTALNCQLCDDLSIAIHQSWLQSRSV